jgi:hypothetical protein
LSEQTVRRCADIVHDEQTFFGLANIFPTVQPFFCSANIFPTVQPFFCSANIFPDARTFYVLYSCNFYDVVICYIIINDMQTLLGFDRLLPDNDYRVAIKIWKAHTLSLSLVYYADLGPT